ncbi:MAG: PIN domain-containing protein [Halanaerobiales bacterium]
MNNILIDTSMWIEYFKGNKAVHDIIQNNNDYEVFITGPILTELIQGIKTKKEKGRFTMCINGLAKLRITDEDWLDAGNLGNILRRKGITVPLPDLIIFTVAVNNNCSLFTLDKHFSIIKEAIESDIKILST